MKKLFLISLACLSVSANPNAQLCELFKKAGAKTPSDMATIAVMSGVIKKDKKDQAKSLIQKTAEEYNKANPKPTNPACEEIEKALAKADILSFQSKLPQNPEKPLALTPPKTPQINKPTLTETAKPKNLAETLKDLPRADSYKIYNILKNNNFLSSEAKKDNKRKEIIEIINQSLTSKSGRLDKKDLDKLEKNLKEKNT